MSAQRKTLEKNVEIPGICFIRQPESTRRCTLSAGYYGAHRHFYSGQLTHGFRAATGWRQRPGENQAD
ncbi:hypothetical protein [Streptomyces longhuiensis]|uniref:hypothetical protein n=1 Tax=Streptomyces longhuiensis TaxID=2880933 RepID=UPI001D0B22E2|nr:hypothetical protein [Streptomyces longhuiensis]UDM05483.1 hypothetical protein LGI35_45340 [Streptomyces longhuiensis]